jgi:hypothetical protein
LIWHPKKQKERDFDGTTTRLDLLAISVGELDPASESRLRQKGTANIAAIAHSSAPPRPVQELLQKKALEEQRRSKH